MIDDNVLIARIGEAERARILAEDFIAKINTRLEALYPPEFTALLSTWQARVAEVGPRPDFFQWLGNQPEYKPYQPPAVLASSADLAASDLGNDRPGLCLL